VTILAAFGSVAFMQIFMLCDEIQAFPVQCFIFLLKKFSGIFSRCFGTNIAEFGMAKTDGPKFQSIKHCLARPLESVLVCLVFKVQIRRFFVEVVVRLRLGFVNDPPTVVCTFLQYSEGRFIQQLIILGDIDINDNYLAFFKQFVKFGSYIR
jgi:hypothetical protein